MAVCSRSGRLAEHGIREERRLTAAAAAERTDAVLNINSVWTELLTRARGGAARR
jgi:hypothetical protein